MNPTRQSDRAPAHRDEPSWWRDWRAQQRHALRGVEDLAAAFPGLAPSELDAVSQNLKQRRLQLTPYVLDLVRRAPGGDRPLDDDPIWRQLVPRWGDETGTGSAYDGETENWELPQEMVTPIAQRKYDNRVIVRLSNVCHGYCQFCYEALRTLEKETSKLQFQQKHWDATLEFVERTEAIEEVILSGGEPLMHSDAQLDRVLGDLRRLSRPLVVRIHTRSLTFNPFRVSDALVDVFAAHRLNAAGLHVTHPNEITPEFRAGVERLRRAAPILFANIPLLGGVNDDEATMHRLGMQLYTIGVVPHYLYHFMPFSPGSTEFRTPVARGVEVLRRLKRRISNLAVPEFVLPHPSGKHTVPLLGPEEPAPEYVVDADGSRSVRFINWQGEVVDYPDVS